MTDRTCDARNVNVASPIAQDLKLLQIIWDVLTVQATFQFH